MQCDVSAMRARLRGLPAPSTVPGRVGAVVLAGALVAALWPLAGPSAPARADEHLTGLDEAVDSDDAVRDARERLEAAREEAAAIAAELDEVAERFEHARAHRERLADEAAEVADDVETAEDAVADADAVFAQAVGASYKRPGVMVEAGHAVLKTASRRDALHGVALVGQVMAAEQRHAERLAGRAERAGDARAQHETLQASVARAEDDAEMAAAALTDATQRARAEAHASAGEAAEVAAATREHLVAEREEERRREEAARRREAAAGRAAATGGRGPTVVPPGEAMGEMACPVGQPNAFIDSWHFPRTGGRLHKGVDIFADHGMPLYAVADGTVRRVWNNRLGGLSIDVIDDRGDRYYYAHLAAAHVSGGDQVRAGDHIADNGNSGNARATPPHLHWQYHPGDGDPVNPYPLAAMLCR